MMKNAVAAAVHAALNAEPPARVDNPPAALAEEPRPRQRRPWKDADAQALATLIQRRRQGVERLTAEKNRLASAHPHVKPDLEATIAWLEQRLQDHDRDLQQRLRASPVWREADDLLRVNHLERDAQGQDPVAAARGVQAVSRFNTVALPPAGEGSER